MQIVMLLFPATALLIPLLGGVFLFRLGRRYQQKSRLLDLTPVAPIGKIPTGFVHVRGAVACGEPLVSPLTQLACCYYRTTIACLTKSAQGLTSQSGYRTIYNEPAAKPFYLDDGTGKVLVDPTGAEYDVPQVFTTYLHTNASGLTGTVIDPSISGAGAPSEEHLRAYVAKHAESMRGQVHIVGRPDLEAKVADAMAAETTSYRLTEHCLLEKQACSVLGTSDTNGASGSGAAASVHKGTSQPTFVITSRTELQESGRLRLRALGAMAGGAALFGIGAFGLLILLVVGVL